MNLKLDKYHRKGRLIVGADVIYNSGLRAVLQSISGEMVCQTPEALPYYGAPGVVTANAVLCSDKTYDGQYYTKVGSNNAILDNLTIALPSSSIPYFFLTFFRSFARTSSTSSLAPSCFAPSFFAPYVFASLRQIEKYE